MHLIRKGRIPNDDLCGNVRSRHNGNLPQINTGNYMHSSRVQIQNVWHNPGLHLWYLSFRLLHQTGSVIRRSNLSLRHLQYSNSYRIPDSLTARIHRVSEQMYDGSLTGFPMYKSNWTHNRNLYLIEKEE